MRKRKVQDLIDAPKIGDYRVKVEVLGDGTVRWWLEKYDRDLCWGDDQPSWSARGAYAAGKGDDWHKYDTATAATPAAAVKAARREVKARSAKQFNERPIGTFTVRL